MSFKLVQQLNQFRSLHNEKLVLVNVCLGVYRTPVTSFFACSLLLKTHNLDTGKSIKTLLTLSEGNEKNIQCI